MRKLILITGVLTVLAVSTILSFNRPSSQKNLTHIVEMTFAVETILARAHFNPAELERMDRLSQQFPQAANAFQKLCALEKQQSHLSAADYEVAAERYIAQLGENRAQSQKLLQVVLSMREVDQNVKVLKALAHKATEQLKFDASSAVAVQAKPDISKQ